ncbi:hypothetical protein BD779DRAFT_1759020 [Infundibulicybe gibba]|nr:hypothetical protein BD779DRAFT_1759020 [Infundibulicybe gibba]
MSILFNAVIWWSNLAVTATAALLVLATIPARDALRLMLGQDPPGLRDHVSSLPQDAAASTQDSAAKASNCGAKPAALNPRAVEFIPRPHTNTNASVSNRPSAPDVAPALGKPAHKEGKRLCGIVYTQRRLAEGRVPLPPRLTTDATSHYYQAPHHPPQCARTPGFSQLHPAQTPSQRPTNETSVSRPVVQPPLQHVHPRPAMHPALAAPPDPRQSSHPPAHASQQRLAAPPCARAQNGAGSLMYL